MDMDTVPWKPLMCSSSTEKYVCKLIEPLLMYLAANFYVHRVEFRLYVAEYDKLTV